MVLWCVLSCFGCLGHLDFLAFGAVWPLGLFGLWGSLAFGALWPLGLFGLWGTLAFGALWPLGLFGLWGCLAFGALWPFSFMIRNIIKKELKNLIPNIPNNPCSYEKLKQRPAEMTFTPSAFSIKKINPVIGFG